MTSAQRKFAIALYLAAAVSAMAARDSAQTIFSTSRRFVVSGMPATDASTLARWAEDVAERAAAATGLAFDFGEGEYIAIKALDDPAAKRSRVLKAQGYLDGRLQQKLVMVLPAQVDQEDLLEGLCWLLLNHEIVRRQDSALRARSLGRVPDWLSVGLAQNLYKELRARNTEAVLDLAAQGLLVGMGDVVESGQLPEGRWREKYHCGLAVSWLLSQPDYTRRWQDLMARVAAGEPISPAWIARDYLELGDAGALESEWQEWVARQNNVVFEFSGQEQDHLEKLSHLLVIQPSDYGVEPPKDTPVPLSPAALIEFRREPWAKNICAGVAVKVRMLALGQTPDFRNVVEMYAAFFDATGGKRGRVSERALHALLKKADAANLAYVVRRQQEQRYVSAIDRWLDMDRELQSTSRDAPALPERRDVEAYMDEMDRMMSEP